MLTTYNTGTINDVTFNLTVDIANLIRKETKYKAFLLPRAFLSITIEGRLENIHNVLWN